ncbi:chaperone modulatory protein CbpM [Marinobacter nauticus]|uniref:Chaperone modulatory protein CbpM n=1 Tax=Marinobacter nauticus TaxID=2743 RepID=A0A368X4L9_MARNT|nr:chaperone modulator CbpM [Marinobacter nauticus]RCW62883.1 chaperone modulatory protein CbpM [Marinobacter nauticus]
MTTTVIVQLSLEECCQRVELPADSIIEIVEYGIVEPEGAAPPEWRFSALQLSRLRRASRLQRELELDWQAVALVLDLLSEVEQLKDENHSLRSRLERFLEL